MGDFWQHGTITTLQKLGARETESLEQELNKFAKEKRMVLLLPALYSEFETPSLPIILNELQKVKYLGKIVVSLDRADRGQFERVKEMLSVLQTEVRIIWHDGAPLQKLYKELKEAQFKIERPGKGRSVWMSIGYILADKDNYAVALHDTDILSYKREILARLFYPVVHPALNFEFSKGYYARVTDRMFGRVTRLFYTPLIKTLRRVLGLNPFVAYLDSFRYALSGEFALIRDVARGLRISPTWGLEVSMLSEIYQSASLNRICQVEIADLYEHKHRVLQKNKPSEGLIRMANEVAQTLFRVLTQDGIVFSEAFFRTLLTSYVQETVIAIEKYHALALINGLTYDRHSEIEAVEAFTGSLRAAIREFVKNPVGIPLLPAWVRINAAIPDFSNRLSEAVEQSS